jgi:hypothetical protein
MPRTRADAEYEERSFTTPKTNEPVPIRPLKRTRELEDDVDGDKSRSPSPAPSDRHLSPRKLDMDQGVVLASDLAENDDEDDEPGGTQPYVRTEEVEEGEIPELTRCESVGA